MSTFCPTAVHIFKACCMHKCRLVNECWKLNVRSLFLCACMLVTNTNAKVNKLLCHIEALLKFTCTTRSTSSLTSCNETCQFDSCNPACYRDVRPENFLRRGRKGVVLADLAFASLAADPRLLQEESSAAMLKLRHSHKAANRQRPVQPMARMSPSILPERLW